MYSRGYLSCNIMGTALLDGSNVTFLLRSESRFKDLYSIPVVVYTAVYILLQAYQETAAVAAELLNLVQCTTVLVGSSS